MSTKVTTGAIADQAITAAKIADAAITKAKMAALSVGTAQLEDGAATASKAAAGAVVQVVNLQTGAVATGTTTIPVDDTIPQNTEGFEVMTLAITPTSASNKLKIEVVAHVAHGTATAAAIAALFQDSAANALAAQVGNIPSTNGVVPLRFVHYMTAGTASATTFKVRIGSGTAGTVTFNGNAGARLFGGVMASSITITEIKA